MGRWSAVVLAVVLNGFLVGQMLLVRGSAVPVSAVEVREEETVLRRSVRAGERTVMEVSTTGLVEVVIYEHQGNSGELAEFQAGRVPRTAKVFSNLQELSYPLSSVSGSEFFVRIRHVRAGQTRVRYVTGTIDEAMGQLRKGKELVRNRGTVRVDGRQFMALYQLVPGTVVQVEVQGGRGVVGVLKTRDYLDVRDGRAALVSRCRPAECMETSSGRTSLELAVQDYDDRYLVVEGEGLVVTYRVVATPEVLNYISSCT